MSKLHDILRLVLTTSLSNGQIGRSLLVAKNTVRRYRNACTKGKYSWEQLDGLSSAELDARFNRASGRIVVKRMPDFEYVLDELKKRSVTRQLLWEEYREVSPTDALSYSQFNFYLKEVEKRLPVSMRQTHAPGNALFVDFSGKKARYKDLESGRDVEVELFIGVLGYSNFTFALCVRSQTAADWTRCHTSMFDYFGGVPSIVVPDNLKAAVIKAGRQAILNRHYEDVAAHYGFAILPARPNHPKDKGKVEVGVQIVQRWILARLRNLQFFSLEELNAEVARLLEDLNNRPFKRIKGCRRSRFEEGERAALQALPTHRYEFAEWLAAQTVGPDYHLVVRDTPYSVPWRLVGAKIEPRLTDAVVEFFSSGLRVASHRRCDNAGRPITDPIHQPPQHRAYAQRTPQSFAAWAEKIGPGLLAVVTHQFDRKVPALGLPACDILQKLGRQYGHEALEAAAQRAVAIQSPTVKSVRSLLGTQRLRQSMVDSPESQSQLPLHTNLRGPGYFASGGTPC